MEARHYFAGYNLDIPAGPLVDFGYSSGICPLCERCWGLLTPTERLPYYMHLLKFWKEEEGISMDEIRSEVSKQVLAGL